MSASVQSGRIWAEPQQHATRGSRRLADGSQAWLGLVLIIASSIVSIRFLCWVVAATIRLMH